jgi:hypothetical protein
MDPSNQEQQSQLHFDVSHPPSHLRTEDHPSQDVTLTAALSLAATLENQADRFHHQPKKSRNLDDLANLFHRKDTRTALHLLTRRNDISLARSKYVDNNDNDDLSWQIHSHYLDLRVCIGSTLGLAALLPNMAINHVLEFRLDLFQHSRKFGAKYAKLGFDPTHSMLWIGRSTTGENAWLAFVPVDCMGDDADDVPPSTGHEDTMMSEKNYCITIMFLAYALRKIGFRDITVTTRYPDITNNDEYHHATNAM